MTTEQDAQVLRQAGVILRRVSKKPKGWWLTVLVKVLNNTADKIEKGDL